MSPQMGVWTVDDDIAAIAAHAADPDAHHSEEIPLGRKAGGGIDYLVQPGLDGWALTTAALTLDRIYYQPLLIKTPVTLANLYMAVTIAAAGGTVCRLGLYNADRDWQPTTLIEDIGTVAIDGVAVVSIACTQVLQEGRYLIAATANGNATFRVSRAIPEMAAYELNLDATCLIQIMYVAAAYAVLPDPGTVWTTVISSNTGFNGFAWLDVGTP